MKVVIQRTKEASVKVNDQLVGEIGFGLVLLVGVTHDDTKDDVNYIVNKLVNLRIFDDHEGKMNLSLIDVEGSVLSISQFTLYADTKKGRRPSFVKAAKPNDADSLYNFLNHQLEEKGITVETGQFGAMMDVQLINDGPVTIIIDSHDK